ncbi:hypothetical protein TNCV_1747821 [Trichonephila clavipes]|nr:hypothetical protein TNCV_1747821 [Trichonephila clavipes]
MGTLPSSRRGKCVTLFCGVRGTPRNSSACKQQQGRYTNYCCNPYGKAAPITPPLSQINKTKMNNNKKNFSKQTKYRIGLASANVYVKNKICRLLVHYQLSTSYEGFCPCSSMMLAAKVYVLKRYFMERRPPITSDVAKRRLISKFADKSTERAVYGTENFLKRHAYCCVTNGY